MIKRNKHSGDQSEDQKDDSPLMINMNRYQTGNLSCSELMDMNPLRTGYCEKKDNSLLSYFFPCWFSPWKRRFFVLLGSFLYRFESDAGEVVKGVPIPLDCVTTSYAGENIFCVSTIRKVYLIRADSEREAQDWVNAINARKFDSIKENMGHAPLDAATRRANKVAEFLFNKKLASDRKTADAAVANPLEQGYAPY